MSSFPTLLLLPLVQAFAECGSTVNHREGEAGKVIEALGKL